VNEKIKGYLKTGGTIVGGGLVGYCAVKAINPLLWLMLRKLNPHVQVPLRRFSPQRKTIGQGLMVVGALSRQPFLSGIGGGMVFADNDNAVLRKQEWTQDKDGHPDRLNIIRYNIPDWLPWKAKYALLGDLLVELISKPTWNAQKKEWIPPGREHPDVIAVAREIVRANGLDGHDKLAVLRAVQVWVQDNIQYAYDPRWLDVFSHPYLTLKSRVEDCDGQALLAASLGEALGIPMVLILVGQRSPDHYNHILSGGVVDRRIVPIETIPVPVSVNPVTRGKAQWGYMPPHIHKKIIPIP